MRRTRLVFFAIVAVAAAIILTSRLMITVKPADPEPTLVAGDVTMTISDLERGHALLPDLRRSASEQPLKAAVQDVVPILTSLGSIHFIGEITNTGNRPLAKPEVIIALQDDDRHPLLFETGYTIHDVIMPKQTVPVIVLFTNPPPGWQSFDVYLQAQEATGREFIAYAEFHALDAQINWDDLSGYVVSGEAKNTGDLRAEFVQAVVSLYGDDKKIVGVGNAYLDQSKLDPGATSTFSVRIINLAAPPSSFRLQFVGHAK